MAMTTLMRSVLAVCLVVALAAPAHARPNPAATKAGGGISPGGGVVGMPTVPGAPMPYPNKAGISAQGPPVKVMIKTYVDTRDEALKKLAPLLAKPPKDPNTARGQLVTIMGGPQIQLGAVKKVVFKRKAGGGPTGSGGFDPVQERIYLEKIYKLAAQALEHRLRQAKTVEALKKAAEDAPNMVKALARELRAVQDRAKDYLRKAAERIDQRERELAALKKVMEAEREKIRKVGEAKLKARMAEYEKQKSLLGRVEREMASVRSSTMSPVDRVRKTRELEGRRQGIERDVTRSQLAVTQTRQEHATALARQNQKLSHVQVQFDQAVKMAKRKMEQRKKDQESAERFVATVAGNVQHAWQNLLKAGADLLEKKQYKPATIKKRSDNIGAQAQGLAQDEAAPAPVKQTAMQISLEIKKAQQKYRKAYDKAAAARQPLVTGSAVHGLEIFKGVKPSQVAATAKKAFIDLLRKK